MDDLLTDQQQAEAVRGWLRQNGLWLVGGVVLGLAALVGWNQWQRYQESRAEGASVLYDQVLKAANESRLDEARKILDQLTGEYGGTVYADQGRLALARLELDRNDLDAAAALLDQVAGGGSPDELRNIARLRLARLHIYREKPEEALAVLARVNGEAFKALAHEARGDAYLAQGKEAEARSEYQLALAIPDGALNTQLVQAKLDDLAVPAGSSSAESPAASSPVPAP